MKKIISFFLLLVFFTSCAKETVTLTPEKQNFIVQTQTADEFSGVVELEKTGRVSSSQDILLTANASGRVSSVLVKTGDSVQVWQTLATLADNIGSYSINLERASNGVERAQIQYDSTKLQLEKSILDAETALLTLERNLVTLQKNSEQNLLQAQDSLVNSKYAWLDTKGALQLEQLDNNIEKSKLDYQTKLIVDQETIEGFASNLKINFNSMLIVLDDIIQFSDELLGITQANKDKNDRFQDFLGALDSSQKRQTEVELIDLIGLRESQEFLDMQEKVISGNMTESEILEALDYIGNAYEKGKILLNNLETTLNNSLLSVGQLGEIEISSFSSQINGYQASLQGNYSWFISFSTNAKSFLRTYKNNQASLAKAIELQEKDRDIQLINLQSGELSATVGYEKTVIGIDDSIDNLETQIETAQRNLKNARENYDITLRSLQNSISEAQISYASAAKELAKLTVRSPINGTISEKFIDIGQEVFNGSQMFNILSDKTPEVEIAFSFDERNLIEEWQKVYIDVGAERITGTLYALSEVADDNLNYISTVVFESGTNIIGNIVTVKVPVSTDKMLLPLNAITTQWESIGLVKTLSGSTFEEVRVRMGEVFWEYVEIVSCAKNCSDLEIVTSDISNYDENKFVIQEK